MSENTARSWIKGLFDGYSKDVPVYLELLNSTLIVCLSASIIARSKEDGVGNQALSYPFWRERIAKGAFIRLEDLLYDVVFPKSPKELRDAASELSKTAIPEVGPLVKELFSMEPDIRMVQDITEYIIASYYPSVIMEPVGTPSQINRMCVQLLEPGSGSFYDGTAGVGSTCIEAGQYAKRHNKRLFIHAREKLAILCPVLTIRAYISGIEPIEVHSEDVLLSPGSPDGEGPFHYSIMFPPLGQSWDAAKRDLGHYYPWDVPKSNSEWLFVLHQIHQLRRSTGRGIIAVSTGTLFNETTRQIRRSILTENCIECVIGLPGNILPYTQIPLSLLLINRARSKQPDHTILMVQTDRLFSNSSKIRLAEQLDGKMIDQIVSLVKDRKDTPCSRVVDREEIAENDDILLPSRYVVNSRVDSPFGPLIVDLQKMREWPSLGSVSEKIYRGINNAQTSESGRGKRYKMIHYAGVRDGVLHVEALKECFVAADAERYCVQPGDILVSCKGAQIKTCVVPESAGGALLTLNFIGVRLKKHIYCPEFLLYFLNSPAGLSYLWGRQVGTSIITLKNSDLKQMPVPDVPLPLQQKAAEEYRAVCSRVEEAIRLLRLEQMQQEWELYQKMGLGPVLLREEK